MDFLPRKVKFEVPGLKNSIEGPQQNLQKHDKGREEAEACGQKEMNGEASHVNFMLSCVYHLLCDVRQVITLLRESSSSSVKKETEVDNL